MRKLGRWMAVGVASVAGAAGMVALGASAGAAVCPRVYAPVTCSNGKTYTNSCVAKLNHATACVSIPWYEPNLPRAGKRSLVDQPEIPN